MKGHKKFYTFTSEQYEDIKGTYIVYLKSLEEPITNQHIPYKIYSKNNSSFIILADTQKFEMIKIDLSIKTPIMTMENEHNEILTFFKCKDIFV